MPRFGLHDDHGNSDPAMVTTTSDLLTNDTVMSGLVQRMSSGSFCCPLNLAPGGMDSSWGLLSPRVLVCWLQGTSYFPRSGQSPGSVEVRGGDPQGILCVSVGAA